MEKHEIKAFWKGRVDQNDGQEGLRWHQAIQPFDAKEKGFTFLGFCCDEGVKRNKGRVGASKAPKYIRKAMSNFPKIDTSIMDYGNVWVEGEALDKAREVQIQAVEDILYSKSFPIVLGGGHETALGNYMALASKYTSIGIINIDAHFDLREPVNQQSSSGTPFYEAFVHAEQNDLDLGYFCLGIQDFANTKALFNSAQQKNMEWVTNEHLFKGFDYKSNLYSFMSKYEAVYVTVDMDVFDASLAPGVSATNPNGLTKQIFFDLLDFIAAYDNVKLLDLVELNPIYDLDNQTAKLAAQIIWQWIRKLMQK